MPLPGRSVSPYDCLYTALKVSFIVHQLVEDTHNQDPTGHRLIENQMRADTERAQAGPNLGAISTGGAMVREGEQGLVYVPDIRVGF